MDTSSIRSSGAVAVEAEAVQTAFPQVTTGTVATGSDAATGFGADGALQVKDAHAASPVSEATTFSKDISLSAFLWAFKAGSKLDLDGPLMFNGSGTIKQLDNDTLEIAISGKIGNGTIKLERKEGNTFTATVNLNNKPFKMEMKATQNGNTLTFVDRWNPDKKLHFTRDGQMVNLNPDGMSIPGSIDITKQ